MPADPGEALPIAPRPRKRKAYQHAIKRRPLVRQIEREATRAEVVPFLLETLAKMPSPWRSALRVMELRDQGVPPAKIQEKAAMHGEPIPTSESELHRAALEGRVWIQFALIEKFGVVPYYQLRWAGRW